MNKKAFTLVELIAVIVILGVLMSVAIPNALSILERNKALNLVEDAKMFIAEVEYKVKSDISIELPTTPGEAAIVKLSYITDTDLDESPYGLDYNKDTSFVVIARKNNTVDNSYTDVYAVNLNAIKIDSNNKFVSNSRSIPLATSIELNGDNAISLINKKLQNVINNVPTKGSSITVDNTSYTVIDVK